MKLVKETMLSLDKKKKKSSQKAQLRENKG